MGVVQLNQVKTRVLATCGPLVDVTDVSPAERDTATLTRGLAAWVIMQMTDLTPEESASAVTDGFNDNGVDAISVDMQSSTVYLVQSKWNQSGTGSPALGDVHKFIQGFRDVINAEFDRFNDKVRLKQKELDAALSNPNVKFVLLIAHTGQEDLSAPARTAIEDLLREINDPIDTASFQMLSQAELHGFLSRGVHGISPSLHVTLYDWGSTQEPYAAYYGQVEATAVAEWFSNHGTRLFAKNIRQFLGQDSEVNTSIIETLQTRPEHFWYLNNGVTVLCERVATWT